MKNKRLLIILGNAAFLLLIPLIGMQLSDEVDWSGFDFLIMGLLLFGSGLAIEFALRTFSSTRTRLIACIVILGLLFMVWAELAVGVFGTPFAGT
tara:strand:+ start:782 stop:1066 length:285 start_codon:yes stop_codon:yes gene_type:complete